MANDIFGGLGGLLGGLSKTGLIPKDTPEGKLLSAQGELSDLKKQESELLIEIGRQAYAQNPSAWPQHSRLALVQQNIAAAEGVLDEAKRAQEAADAAKAAEDAKGRCPSCGYKNAEGIRFCQECGSSLAAQAKSFCGNCGQENASGTRFCGGCGTRL